MRGLERLERRRPASTIAQRGDELVEAAVAARGLPGRARRREAADRRVLEGLREVAEREPLRGQGRLRLGAAQPGADRGGHRDRGRPSTPRSRRRSSERPPRARPRSGSTPPTTLVPPPNGTTATPLARAGLEHRGATCSALAGQDDRVGRRVEPPARGGGPGPDSCARRRGARAARAPFRTPRGPTARAIASGHRPRLGQRDLLELDALGRARLRRARTRSIASARSASSARRRPSSPQPHHLVGARSAHSSTSRHQGALDALEGLVEAPLATAPRIIGEPRRDMPRSSRSCVERHRGRRRPRLERGSPISDERTIRSNGVPSSSCSQT